MGTDSLMDDLHSAIVVAQTGDHSEARRLFTEIVPRLGDDAGKNCILAHYMADVQDSVADELLWDLRSLHHLKQVTEDQIEVLGSSLRTKGFYASIYLNIANCYMKLGERDQLIKYLDLADASCDLLDQDEYGNFIRSRVALLRSRT